MKTPFRFAIKNLISPSFNIITKKMPSSNEQVYKPNFVSDKSDGNHSSRLFVTQQLERPTRKRRLNRFKQLSGQLIKNVSLFGLAPRGVCLAALVTKRADALLPHRFTHHPCGLVCSLLHLSSFNFFWKSNARTLSGSPPFGVRTFLFLFSIKSDYPTCSTARLKYLSKNCSTNTIES